MRDERELYEAVWDSVPSYGEFAPGEHYVPMFQAMSGATQGRVLDAGCGSGKGSIALHDAGFWPLMMDVTPAGLCDEARFMDFAQACLWDDVRKRANQPRFDYVYCCDVLEHIPTEYTMLVLHRLFDACKVDGGVFLSIALVPDNFGVWVGRPLHQTVREFTWWRDRIADLGRLVDARDLGHVGLYYAVPA